MIALKNQLTMQTLKDRLIGLLSSPTQTKFKKIEDYDNDNLSYPLLRQYQGEKIMINEKQLDYYAIFKTLC